MVNLKTVAKLQLQMKEDETQMKAQKEQLRAGAKVSNKAYASVTYADQVNYSFTPEDQLKVDAFCKENGIEKVKTVKKDYRVTITPTQKAIDEYEREKRQ